MQRGHGVLRCLAIPRAASSPRRKVSAQPCLSAQPQYALDCRRERRRQAAGGINEAAGPSIGTLPLRRRCRSLALTRARA